MALALIPDKRAPARFCVPIYLLNSTWICEAFCVKKTYTINIESCAMNGCFGVFGGSAHVQKEAILRAVARRGVCCWPLVSIR